MYMHIGYVKEECNHNFKKFERKSRMKTSNGISRTLSPILGSAYLGTWLLSLENRKFYRRNGK
jgi:hypothetical protein